MRKKLEEKDLLATIDIEVLEPKGSDGFLSVNAVFRIEPELDNSVN